jgi:hypothetical protein
MPTLTIRGLRTVNQNGVNATFFHPFFDALALTLDCHASADLLALPGPRFHAQFEILNPSTDIIVVNSGWSNPFAWGQYFWISMGNNWGPPGAFTTPEKWGIHPAAHGWNEVFGFRGIIKAYSWQGEKGELEVDAFDVSPIRWFRVGRTATL